jgi:hypothetical protein
MSAEGYKNDAPASIVNDSTALTLESIISLLKALKNLQIDIKADAANQTTLAAILAKLSSDPATQTTLAAISGKLSSDPATQTTLASILAKLSSDPATQTTLATMASDIALMKIDLAAIRAILES